ncbi:helix-turn-helix transcriptional regulator [Actinomadura sp. WMMA1423]|uniref:helix-turn-helix transcriptional regulator n=1 Tax=Actinomadura sp. WMMA1423 TaxID=2591108 RepID=UPI001146A597|nr:helix-turn-helix transcriptional regulator [Actinomadura sp. WMMA1423]
MQAIHRCCGVSLLKAHRLAQGWTAQAAIDHLAELCERERLGVPHANIDLLNVWENGRGRPRPDTIDLLSRLYRANPIKLGLAADYSDDTDVDEVAVIPAPHIPPLLPASSQAPVLTPSALHTPGPSGPLRDETNRRTFFNDVLTGCTRASHGRLLAEVETLRQQMDRTLASGTVTDDQMDRLEEMVLQCRRDYLVTPPLPMLCRLMLEFSDVQNLASQRQSGSIQCRLSKIAAVLAVLSADALMKLGDVRQAAAWYGTAKTAADDTGDPQLRALVRAHQAMLPYYYGDPAETVSLAREAQALGRAKPSSPTALAAAAEARALARIGDHQGAIASLARAQRLFSQIKERNNGALAFDFTEQRLYLYMSGTHAYLPDLQRAEAVHDTASALCRPTSPNIDPALVKLDRAATFARGAREAEACELATQTLLELPPEQRTTIVFVRARDVRSALPTQRWRDRALNTFEEVLALDTATVSGRRDA